MKGISEAIGVHELLNEWDIPGYTEIKVQTDSSAAKGTLTRRGSGKIKHLTTKQLWVQEAIKSYGVKVERASRNINTAYILNHQCNKQDFEEHIHRAGIIRP